MPPSSALPSWSAGALLGAIALSTVALGGTTHRAPSIALPQPQAAAAYAPGEVVVGFRSGASLGATHAALMHTGVERPSTPLAPFSTVALRRGLSVPEATAR